MANLMERRKNLVDAMMRDAIYEGALAVLAERGLSGTTMDRVASAAGVAKGSLYNYFRSKDELLTFVHEKTVEPLQEENRRIAESDQRASEKIEAMIRSWRHHVGEHRAAFQILIRNSTVEGVLRESRVRRESEAVDTIAKVIESGIEAGEFHTVNAKYVAEMLLASAKAGLEAEFAEGVQRSDEEMVGTLIAVFLQGLHAN